jgi:hypothetical protein
MYAFTERSLALGTLVSPTNSDDFIYDSSGTLTLIFGPKWSTANSRGTGAGTTELALQDGVWVNKVAISGGPAATAGRYLGTISWTSTTTTEDSLLHRLVWNCYNRQPRKMKKTSSTSSWTYNSTSFRNAANDVANQLDFVVGLAEVQADIVVYVMSTDNAGGSIVPGIGIDGTTNIAEILQRGVSGQTITCPHLARLIHYPSIGQHQYNWLEALSAGTTATTSFGGDGASFISGIYGTIWG